MSCERAGDAILDELGLTLRSSKAQVGKKFPRSVRTYNDRLSPRVNPGIWEKLSTQTKSRDVKSQRTQNALVGAIAEIVVTANTLVRSSRSGDPLSGPEMGTAFVAKC